jgi:hypothetical protein
MRLNTIAPLAGALLGAFACADARADADAVNIVFHPIVEYGEKEAEVRGFVTHDSDPAKSGDAITKADVAYGITPRWWSELEFVWDKPAQQGTQFAAIATENVFQLTEQGEYFADFGLFAEYERAVHENINEIVLAPIVQKQVGPILATANLFLSREFGTDAESSKLEKTWAAQAIWRGDERFEPGIEYYGAANNGQVGPGLFGTIRFGSNKLKWQAVALFATTQSAPDETFRWGLEYEFH